MASRPGEDMGQLETGSSSLDMEAGWQVVLFDLDGTLSDSAPGILAALRYAFAANGIAPLDAVTERSLLGPPFHDSLPPLVGVQRVPDVVAAYREHYQHGGMFDTSVYAGVPELLAACQAAGVRMAVATSKPERFALPIVERLGLAPYFETIGGDTPTGSLGTKELVLGVVLQRLGRPEPGTVLMVGDRSHDVDGARAHGIGCAGAAWGYGSPGELAGAGADPICATPAELGRALRVDHDGPVDQNLAPGPAAGGVEGSDAAAS